MKYASTQELFDKSATHLLNQMVQSMNKSASAFGCTYRGLEGRMCAVGVHIADEHYDNTPDADGMKLEGNTVFDDRVKLALIKSGALHPGPVESDENTRNLNLLSRLQEAHDNHTPDRWRQQLLNTAHSFNLDNSIIYKVEKEQA
jgi:hypothetical protein